MNGVAWDRRFGASDEWTHAPDQGLWRDRESGGPFAVSADAQHRLREGDIDALYLPFEVRDLGDFVRSAAPLGIAGFSVTIPHKQAILRYLDGYDPLAAEIGAVNTVLLRGTRLYGYNTDYVGVLQALEKATFHCVPAGCYWWAREERRERLHLRYAQGCARSRYKRVARRKPRSWRAPLVDKPWSRGSFAAGILRRHRELHACRLAFCGHACRNVQDLHRRWKQTS